MAIRKTTKGKDANYRPTKKGAGMTAKGTRAKANRTLRQYNRQRRSNRNIGQVSS